MTDLIDCIVPTYTSRDIGDLNSQTIPTNFVILNYNVRGLRKRFVELEVFLAALKFKPAILALTETQLKTDLPFKIDNYTCEFPHEIHYS